MADLKALGTVPEERLLLMMEVMVGRRVSRQSSSTLVGMGSTGDEVGLDARMIFFTSSSVTEVNLVKMKSGLGTDC